MEFVSNGQVERPLSDRSNQSGLEFCKLLEFKLQSSERCRSSLSLFAYTFLLFSGRIQLRHTAVFGARSLAQSSHFIANNSRKSKFAISAADTVRRKFPIATSVWRALAALIKSVALADFKIKNSKNLNDLMSQNKRAAQEHKLAEEHARLARYVTGSVCDLLSPWLSLSHLATTLRLASRIGLANGRP